MKYIIFLTFFFLFSVSFSQDTVYARKVIKKLCSKEFSGRGYVNDGVNKAASYLSKEIKNIGLNKFGKSYSQFYNLRVNTFPGAMSVVLNGRELTPGMHYLIYPSAKTTKEGFQLFKTDSVTYKATDGKREVPLQVKLKKKLTYTVESDLSDNTIIELLKDSFPNELKTIDVIFENKLVRDFKCQNLCGYVKGTQHPDSFIVFTAHYDHLGMMGKETCFPGANDNASGVSVLLNLAKYYKAHPAKYSVSFIFFSGEEAGLLGSKYFSNNPLFALSKIKFLTNLDLLGTGDDGIMVVNATVFKEQFEKLNSINTEKHYLKQIKQRGKAANSDHYWFTELGVPSFFIYTMGGIQAYHDIYDIDKTLPLTKYIEVCQLLIEFNSKL
ncbi:MAG: M28 family peptidase [Burkholderiales bacterium]|nr:M28 family peptidase [Bacteroidia bacterium]